MNDSNINNIPEIYADIAQKSIDIGFNMPSDLYVGTLLKTLVASKPQGNFLELGTGIGLSLSWMVDGMDKNSSLTTIDNDPELIGIANQYFGHDTRIKLICADGTDWIKQYEGPLFNLVFADAWPGKYSETGQILDLISIGGFYVVDDMSQQPNWPEGHEDNVQGLISYLEKRADFTITKLDWSTGLIIAVKSF